MPGSPSRSRLITRRPAAPAATASRPRPGCSGRAEDFARARQRIETEVEPERRAGRARAAQRARRPSSKPPTCRRAILLRHFGEDPPEQLRQLRQLPRPAGDDRRDRSRAQIAVGRVPDRDALRGRVISPTCLPATTMRRCAASAITSCPCSESPRRRGTRAGPAGGAGADRPRCAARRRLWRAVVRAGRQADPQGRGGIGHRRPAAAQATAGAAHPKDRPIPCSRRCARRARKLAAEAGVPPYVIFHDSTLREIAAQRPRSSRRTWDIQGVGETKLARYGEAMLDAVAAAGGDGR